MTVPAESTSGDHVHGKSVPRQVPRNTCDKVEAAAVVHHVIPSFDPFCLFLGTQNAAILVLAPYLTNGVIAHLSATRTHFKAPPSRTAVRGRLTWSG